MNASEFREMNEVNLSQEVEARRRQILDLRCQVALGEEIGAHQIKHLKKEIARIQTVLREKEVAAAAAVGESE